MAADADLWDRFAARSSPRREGNTAGERTGFNWTHYPDHGPDESVLGDVRGKAVLDLAATVIRFDVVYSVFGPVWFTDPATLLPLIHARLDPGGVLAFSHLPHGH